MTIQAPERHARPEVEPAPHIVRLRRERRAPAIGPLLTSLVVIAALVALAVVSLAMLPVGDELAQPMELSWTDPGAMQISRTWVFDPAGEHGFTLDADLHPTMIPIGAATLRDLPPINLPLGP